MRARLIGVGCEWLLEGSQAHSEAWSPHLALDVWHRLDVQEILVRQIAIKYPLVRTQQVLECAAETSHKEKELKLRVLRNHEEREGKWKAWRERVDSIEVGPGTVPSYIKESTRYTDALVHWKRRKCCCADTKDPCLSPFELTLR